MEKKGIRCTRCREIVERVCSSCWKCEKCCDCNPKERRWVNGHIGEYKQK